MFIPDLNDHLNAVPTNSSVANTTAGPTGNPIYIPRRSRGLAAMQSNLDMFRGSFSSNSRSALESHLTSCVTDCRSTESDHTSVKPVPDNAQQAVEHLFAVIGQKTTMTSSSGNLQSSTVKTVNSTLIPPTVTNVSETPGAGSDGLLVTDVGHLQPPESYASTPTKTVQSTSSCVRGILRCPYCDKAFSNSSAIAKHKLTHSEERKYVCSICHKAFKRQDHLNGHKYTHESRKPHACHFCDKSYSDARSLRRHYENAHPEEYERWLMLSQATNGDANAIAVAAAAILSSAAGLDATGSGRVLGSSAGSATAGLKSTVDVSSSSSSTVSTLLTAALNNSPMRKLLASSLSRATPTRSNDTSPASNMANESRISGGLSSSTQRHLDHRSEWTSPGQSPQSSYSGQCSLLSGATSPIGTGMMSTMGTAGESPTHGDPSHVPDEDISTPDTHTLERRPPIRVPPHTLTAVDMAKVALMMAHPLEAPKRVACAICAKRFKNQSALNGHMRLHGGYGISGRVGSDASIDTSSIMSSAAFTDSAPIMSTGGLHPHDHSSMAVRSGVDRKSIEPNSGKLSAQTKSSVELDLKPSIGTHTNDTNLSIPANTAIDFSLTDLTTCPQREDHTRTKDKSNMSIDHWRASSIGPRHDNPSIPVNKITEKQAGMHEPSGSTPPTHEWLNELVNDPCRDWWAPVGPSNISAAANAISFTRDSHVKIWAARERGVRGLRDGAVTTSGTSEAHTGKFARGSQGTTAHYHGSNSRAVDANMDANRMWTNFSSSSDTNHRSSDDRVDLNMIHTNCTDQRIPITQTKLRQPSARHTASFDPSRSEQRSGSGLSNITPHVPNWHASPNEEAHRDTHTHTRFHGGSLQMGTIVTAAPPGQAEVAHYSPVTPAPNSANAMLVDSAEQPGGLSTVFAFPPTEQHLPSTTTFTSQFRHPRVSSPTIGHLPTINSSANFRAAQLPGANVALRQSHSATKLNDLNCTARHWDPSGNLINTDITASTLGQTHAQWLQNQHNHQASMNKQESTLQQHTCSGQMNPSPAIRSSRAWSGSFDNRRDLLSTNVSLPRSLSTFDSRNSQQQHYHPLLHSSMLHDGREDNTLITLTESYIQHRPLPSTMLPQQPTLPDGHFSFSTNLYDHTHHTHPRPAHTEPTHWSNGDVPFGLTEHLPQHGYQRQSVATPPRQEHHLLHHDNHHQQLQVFVDPERTRHISAPGMHGSSSTDSNSSFEPMAMRTIQAAGMVRTATLSHAPIDAANWTSSQSEIENSPRRETMELGTCRVGVVDLAASDTVAELLMQSHITDTLLSESTTIAIDHRFDQSSIKPDEMDSAHPRLPLESERSNLVPFHGNANYRIHTRDQYDGSVSTMSVIVSPVRQNSPDSQPHHPHMVSSFCTGENSEQAVSSRPELSTVQFELADLTAGSTESIGEGEESDNSVVTRLSKSLAEDDNLFRNPHAVPPLVPKRLKRKPAPIFIPPQATANLSRLRSPRVWAGSSGFASSSTPPPYTPPPMLSPNRRGSGLFSSITRSFCTPTETSHTGNSQMRSIDRLMVRRHSGQPVSCSEFTRRHGFPGQTSVVASVGGVSCVDSDGTLEKNCTSDSIVSNSSAVLGHVADIGNGSFRPLPPVYLRRQLTPKSAPTVLLETWTNWLDSSDVSPEHKPDDSQQKPPVPSGLVFGYDDETMRRFAEADARDRARQQKRIQQGESIIRRRRRRCCTTDLLRDDLTSVALPCNACPPTTVPPEKVLKLEVEGLNTSSMTKSDLTLMNYRAEEALELVQNTLASLDKEMRQRQEDTGSSWFTGAMKKDEVVTALTKNVSEIVDDKEEDEEMEDDEEAVGDEFDDEGVPCSIIPRINIGDAFQAAIPEFCPLSHVTSDETNIRETLLWYPDNLDEKDPKNIESLNLLMKIACSPAVRNCGLNMEYTFHLLCKYKGNLEKTLHALLYETLVVYDYVYAETTAWTTEEISRFQYGLRLYGRDFHQVAKDLQANGMNKTVKACVEFYYVWKRMNTPSDVKWYREKARRQRLANARSLDCLPIIDQTSNLPVTLPDPGAPLPEQTNDLLDTSAGRQTSCYNLRRKHPAVTNSTVMVPAVGMALDKSGIHTPEHRYDDPIADDSFMPPTDVSWSSRFHRSTTTNSNSSICLSSATNEDITTTAVVPSDDDPFPLLLFPCQMCPRVFAKVKSRNAHMKSHSNNNGS